MPKKQPTQQLGGKRYRWTIPAAGLPSQPGRSKRDWKSVVSTTVAIAALVFGLLQFRWNRELVQREWDSGAPFLDIRLNQQKTASPRLIQIKNAGKRTAYDVSLSGIAGSRLPRSPSEEVRPPAKPDRVPLPKTFILGGDAIDVSVPEFVIPGDAWQQAIGKTQVLNVFYLLNFSDERGVHTEWFCFEYTPEISLFAACPNFHAPLDVWVKLGPEVAAR